MHGKESDARLLIVDDDAASQQYIHGLLDSGNAVRTLFADTKAALKRTFKSETVGLVVLHLNKASTGLFKLVLRLARDQDPRIPLLVLVDDQDAESALAAADAGVEGMASFGDERGIRRLLKYFIEHSTARGRSEKALQKLKEIESRYSLLLESSNEAVAYLHEGLHVYANPAYLKLFGYAQNEDMQGLSMLDLLTTGEKSVDLKHLHKALSHDEIPDASLEVLAHRSDGSTFAADASFFSARYEGENCVQMVIRERAIDTDQELEKKLQQLRTRDLLTGLYNRQAFLERLYADCENPDSDVFVAVLVFQLDDLAKLQEKLGFGAADSLIRQSADLLSSAVDESAYPARLGDHTFALRLLIPERQEAERLARQIVEHCSGHIIEVRDKSLTVTASVGLAIAGSYNADAEELIGQAETALGEASRTGGSSYVRYRPRISETVDTDENWLKRLRHALDNDEFRLVELPITSMEDDHFIIHEVEARLRSEDSDEVLLPETYLPVAARVGLATDLDRDLIQRFADLLKSSTHPDDSLWMLPLCGATLGNKDAVNWIQEQLDAEVLPARQMIFGLRETDIRDQIRTAQQFIQRFATRGVRFSLIEVGQDAHLEPILKNLDVQFIKLLPEMTFNIGGNEPLRHKLEIFIRHADERDVKLIAPRVEHTSDLATLWQFGVTLVQGDFVREETRASG